MGWSFRPEWSKIMQSVRRLLAAVGAATFPTEKCPLENSIQNGATFGFGEFRGLHI